MVPEAGPVSVTAPYRGKSGQWMFISHRITGFLVFMFLMLHVVDVSLVQNKHLYNEVHAVYGNVLLRVFESGWSTKPAASAKKRKLSAGTGLT